MSLLGTGSRNFHGKTNVESGKTSRLLNLAWPLGLPLVRKIGKYLWEVRSRLEDGIARVFFTVDGDHMILLHGFIKKSQKTPPNELKTALSRLGNFKRGNK